MRAHTRNGPFAFRRRELPRGRAGAEDRRALPIYPSSRARYPESAQRQAPIALTTGPPNREVAPLMSEQLPKNLTLEALALSPAEQRSFPRWYTDLLLRKRTDSVAVGDVLAFVDNFGLSGSDKRAITNLFGERLVTVDPPQFYVFLRLTGHILQGKRIHRELAFVAAPVPRPRPILSRKTKPRPQQPQDMDSFMSLMTGGGGVKKKKRVTFDTRPPQVTEAAHRSMSELLRQHQIHNQLPQISLPAPPPPPPAAPEPDPEPEPELPINSQFAKLNIESVLHNGTSSVPTPPAPRKQSQAGDSFIHQLTQTTGGAMQPQHSGVQSATAFRPGQGLQQQGTGLQQQGTGLQQQGTGLQQQGTGLQQQGTGLQQQGTGFQQPNGFRPGLQQQGTGLQQQGTGFQGLQQQGTGFQQFAGPQPGGLQQKQGPPVPPRPAGLQTQSTGQFTGLQNQGTGQFQGLQPQGSGQFQGLQPQGSGQFQGLQPQGSGQFQGLQPQGSGQFQGIQPQGSGQFQGMQSQGSGQFQGVQPQAAGQFPGMAPQGSGQFQQFQGPGQFQGHAGHFAPQSMNGHLGQLQPPSQLGQQGVYAQPQFGGATAPRLAAQTTSPLPMNTHQQAPPPPPNRLAPPSFQSFTSGLSSQGTGLSPSHTGYASQVPAMTPQPTQIPQTQPQVAQIPQQFVGNLHPQGQFQIAPPPQYVRKPSGQAYNMAALRDQTSHW